MNHELKTHFDSPERSTQEEINKRKKNVLNNSVIVQLLEGFPNIAVILDQNRQIIAYNSKAVKAFFSDETDEIYGQRFGEALKCIHALEMPAGCGTSKHCSTCGVGNCAKKSFEFYENFSDESRITSLNGVSEVSHDFRAFSTIIDVLDEKYVLLSVEDIKDEKRRKVLEKIFFHDVLNTASSIHGLSELITSTDNLVELHDFGNLLLNSSDHLILEIKAQRDLINAENGSLSINIEPESVNNIIRYAYDLYKNNELSKKKNYIIIPAETDKYIITDRVLLVRSLGNLIKNALEASEENGSVKISADVKDDFVFFNIQNGGVIPKNVQLQIFQRSFSTKSSLGRGIGTYSVKLLIEHYLSGNVSFLSNDDVGTVFTIKLPINPEQTNK